MSPQVLGKTVVGQTRCAHDSTELNIIAIRFACRRLYYPCNLCRAECAGHLAKQWPRDEQSRSAILCDALDAADDRGLYEGGRVPEVHCAIHHRALRRIRRFFGTSFLNI